MVPPNVQDMVTALLWEHSRISCKTHMIHKTHFVSERDVGSSVEQSSDHVYMSMFCCPDDGRPTAAILKHRDEVKTRERLFLPQNIYIY